LARAFVWIALAHTFALRAVVPSLTPIAAIAHPDAERKVVEARADSGSGYTIITGAVVVAWCANTPRARVLAIGPVKVGNAL
jgi:hypothetical protein